MENLSYKNSTLGSLFWSALGKFAPQIIIPLISIYIARLLSPEIYGLVAIANIVVSFVSIFMASGFFTALIQKKGNKSEIYQSANFVFSINLIFSIFLFSIIFFSSGLLANFFNEQEAQNVIKVLAVTIIIIAFGRTQRALLQKTMDFKSIFIRQIIPIFSLLIVTLPMAKLGYGVWALITGQIISEIMASIILWIKSEWKPKLNLNYKENKDILSFGFWVIIQAFLAWVLIQGDGLIVGKFFSTSELGLYRKALDFVNKISGFVVIPIIPVFYAKFCSLKNAEDIKEYYLKLKEYISLLIFPLLFGIILISPYFEFLLLNERWKGIGFVMAALTITGVSNLWALMGNFFRARGKPKIPVKILIINNCLCIPLWLYFIQYGFKMFILARIGGVFIGIVLNTYYENRELNISVFQALKFYYKAFLAAIGMFIIGFAVQHFLFKNQYTLFFLISLIFISAITYMTTIHLIDKEHFFVMKSITFDRFINKVKKFNNK